MRMTNGRYYRTLFGGWLLIVAAIFLWHLAQSSSASHAAEEILLPMTFGIWVGASRLAVLFYVIVSACLMGYGLLVRKRYALALFWSGFLLFFMAGMMGLRS